MSSVSKTRCRFWVPPILKALQILAIPVVLTVVATELPVLQRFLSTQSLTNSQWLAVIILALAPVVVIEGDKAIRKRRRPTPEQPIEESVSPARAISVHRSR